MVSKDLPNLAQNLLTLTDSIVKDGTQRHQAIVPNQEERRWSHELITDTACLTSCSNGLAGSLPGS
ncbi:MAG TPA: hypothetical protein DCZ69_10880 [Syntrophobacteraceae bacterium]|nr:hypothetical protein [Syntrophobacteraceae bacterium]